jgi:predicted TIM-barrel fold metal-dependent hydrolase
MKSLLRLMCVLIAAPLIAQQPDPQLLAEINKLKAIDNHSHPPKLVAAGEKDDDFDALPCDPLEQAPMPAKIREDNPNFIRAWKALYGYRYNDAAPEHVKELLTAKQRVRTEQGDNFPNWVLDQLGIETEFANRVAMGRGLQPPRFRWVPFADALLFPLNNAGVGNTPDRKFFFSREEMLLKRYRSEVGVSSLPANLNDYVAKIVVPVLERWKKQEAVAIKFEAAYLRSLDFMPAAEADAARVYASWIAKIQQPPGADYRLLQNFLFRRIAQEAGRLKLAVHFHSAAGCGTYFRLADANPLNMESVFDDPALRGTTFVIIHGGWPFTKEAAALMMKPNVWVDFSEQTWLLSPRQIADSLRTYLEWYPEKVLFGTDLYPGSPEIDWEEIGWVTTNDARRALAIALTGMVEDGVISGERALQIAHMALHDNAAKLYGLGAAR